MVNDSVITLPPNIDELCSNQNAIDIYANFLFLKYFFQNGCIYNYNHHQLALKTGKSFRFIKRTVEHAIKKNWCYFHHKNLIFANRKNQSWGTFKNTTVITKGSIAHIKLQLRKIIIDNKISRCKYVHKLRSDRNNPQAAKQLKCTIKKLAKLKKAYTGEMNPNVNLSYNKLSQIFNCSPSNAFKIVKKLCENNMLVKHNVNKSIYTNVSLGFFKSFISTVDFKSKFFFKNRVIYEICANEYQTMP